MTVKFYSFDQTVTEMKAMNKNLEEVEICVNISPILTFYACSRLHKPAQPKLLTWQMT